MDIFKPCSNIRMESLKKSELYDTIKYEEEQYSKYMFKSCRRKLMAAIKAEPTYLIMRWQNVARMTDYYYDLSHTKGGLINKILYLWYISRRNRLARRLGLEIGTKNISKGLFVYHYSGGCVVNEASIIGENCHFHGNNCIGNAGPHDLRCPIIGNNVIIGVGAKIIGAVKIANNIKIAAGAVVVHSFEEEGITIAGIPAKKVK